MNEDAYRCINCGRGYVVPGLAKDCERRDCKPVFFPEGDGK